MFSEPIRCPPPRSHPSRVLVGIGTRQATIASLASDKAAAQSHAAELEARLARVAGDHRRRAEKSRQANAVAVDRLSVAESRALAAEARVETVVRHLTLSECRLREGERRAAEGARSEAKERAAAVEAASAKGARMDDAGHQKKTGGLVADVAFVGHRATERSSRHVSENEEGRYGIQLPPSPSGGTENHNQKRTSRSVSNRKRGTSHASGFANERQQHGDTAALQENRDPAGSLTVALGFATSDKEDTANILREVEAARRQVAVAEQQAVILRVNANRVKAEAAKTAAEAEIGTERAMMESERLARELKATGIEVWHAEGGSRFRIENGKMLV